MNAKTRYKAKKIKAVFFDIDDTLRVKGTGYMPQSITTVFKALKAKNILTGIASGRAPYGVVPEIRDLDPDYFITINGAYVIDRKGDELADLPIEQQVVADFVAWCDRIGLDYGFVGKDRSVLSARKAFIDDAIVPVYGVLDVAPEFHLTNSVYQMWTFSKDHADLDLPKNLADHVRLIPWHPVSSDVVTLGLSKASGLDDVLAKEGLRPENVLFFGDGPNDMEMFDRVGLKIAMGNAVEALKEKADAVTGSVEEEGILHALEELGLIEKELTLPQLDLETVEGPVATIKTNYGDLVMKLFPKQAPKTVANFLALAKDGYYDGVIFHRIIKEFMIQGGDPTGTGMGGESIYGDSFEDEFSEELYHLRGALSMANAGPNTNGSQFFIVQNTKASFSAKELSRAGWPEPVAISYVAHGGTPHLDRRHTVFGQLVDQASFEVLDKIATVETGAQDRPVDDVIIETIEVLES